MSDACAEKGIKIKKQPATFQMRLKIIKKFTIFYESFSNISSLRSPEMVVCGIKKQIWFDHFRCLSEKNSFRCFKSSWPVRVRLTAVRFSGLDVFCFWSPIGLGAPGVSAASDWSRLDTTEGLRVNLRGRAAANHNAPSRPAQAPRLSKPDASSTDQRNIFFFFFSRETHRKTGL